MSPQVAVQPDLMPANEAELAEAVRGAGPLRIVGGGTRWIGRAEGRALRTCGLSGIRLYEPGALTLVAGAGTPLAEVEAVLAGEGQRLAFEVPDLRALLGRQGASTIGGVAAANAAGPRRVQVGAARDHLIGVRFVDGRGEVIRNGGRVMKNVTGYDLVKLVAGSHGSLGVLSEVAFKLQAIPEAEISLVAALPLAAGLVALREALRSPFDISGAAYAQGQAMLRLEGMAGSVAYRAGRLRALLGGDWQVVEGEASRALWRGLRDVQPLEAHPGAIWRLSVTPTEAEAVLTGLGDHGHQAVVDWGGGLIWLALDAPGSARVRGLTEGRGHATLIRPLPGDPTPAFPPEAPAIAALTRGLRRKFDPRGILNPGVMG